MAPILFTVEELSNYEHVRSPQDIVDDTSLLVHSDSVRTEFTCIICLEILKKTMTSQHCLHRFCYDCITTSLRLGNKECPTCRAKLASKRDLRADPVFDSLIATLFSQEIQQQKTQGGTKFTQTYKGLHQTTLQEPSYKKIQNSSCVGSKRNGKQKVLKEHKTINSEEKPKIDESPRSRKCTKSKRKKEKTSENKEIVKNNIEQQPQKSRLDSKEDHQTIHDDNNKQYTVQNKESKQVFTRKSTRLEAVNIELNKDKQEKIKFKEHENKAVNTENTNIKNLRNQNGKVKDFEHDQKEINNKKITDQKELINSSNTKIRRQCTNVFKTNENTIENSNTGEDVIKKVGIDLRTSDKKQRNINIDNKRKSNKIRKSRY